MKLKAKKIKTKFNFIIPNKLRNFFTSWYNEKVNNNKMKIYYIFLFLFSNPTITPIYSYTQPTWGPKHIQVERKTWKKRTCLSN